MLHTNTTLAIALLCSMLCCAGASAQAASSNWQLPTEVMAGLASDVYDVVNIPGYTVRMAERCWPTANRPAERNILCRQYHRAWQRKSPEDFVTLFVFREAGGVSAAVFEHKTSQSVVLAFVGSDQIVDWLVANQNIARLRGKKSQGLQRVAAGALDIAGKLGELKRRDGSLIPLHEVHVVGHSLGGYLTQMVTVLLPVRSGVSFNGPGLYRMFPRSQDELDVLLGERAAQYKRRYPARRMQNHIKQLDPIGRFGRHFGIVYLYRSDGKKAHSMEVFRSELEAQTIKPYKVLYSSGL
ncbi:MAG: hypothetical protein AAFR90_04685 [Pseudomonadota bacterium]